MTKVYAANPVTLLPSFGNKSSTSIEKGAFLLHSMLSSKNTIFATKNGVFGEEPTFLLNGPAFASKSKVSRA